MSDIPLITLPYEQSISNAYVYSKHQNLDKFYVRVPDEIFNNYEFDKIVELDSDFELKRYVYWGYHYLHEGIDPLIPNDTVKRPWLDIELAELDLSVGMHLYRIHWVHKVSKTLVYTYFTFYVQDTDVDKPYIYMNDKTTCTDKGGM